MHQITALFVGLGVDSSILWMAGIFIGTLALMYVIALKRLSDYVDERYQRTEGREHQIHDLREELKEITVKVQASLTGARSEAGAVFAGIRAEAGEKQKKLLQDARTQATAQIGAARDQGQAYFKAEYVKIEADIPAISRLITEQILGGRAPQGAQRGS